MDFHNAVGFEDQKDKEKTEEYLLIQVIDKRVIKVVVDGGLSELLEMPSLCS